jgi:pyruvate-formate lyase
MRAPSTVTVYRAEQALKERIAKFSELVQTMGKNDDDFVRLSEEMAKDQKALKELKSL